MKNKMKVKNIKQASKTTLSIHGLGDTPAWEFGHHLIPPMTASTTFRLQSLKRGAQGFIDFAQGPQEKTKGSKDKSPILIYDRLAEPTTLMLEEQMAMLENAEIALSFGSGMGAITTSLLAMLGKGQKVVAHRTLYGCTHSLLTHWLPKLGIETEQINMNDFKDLDRVLLNPQVRILYYESLSNPSLELIDIEPLVKKVKKANLHRKLENQVLVIVDNTFPTPRGHRPLEWGADMVIQSLTKNISGFGTEMGGAIMTSKKYYNALSIARKDFGAVITPYAAWHILVYGISTQSMRFDQQTQNSLKIAKFLEKHPKVERVIYPGLKSYYDFKLAKKYLKSPEGQFAPGTMISFFVKGNMKTCEKFIDDVAQNSYAITLAVSLGLNKTLIEVPGYMTHSGIPEKDHKMTALDPRMIRLSVGLESVEDLISDLSNALNRLKI